MNFNTFQDVRQQSYACLKHGADALFNLTDALLSEPQARSLPELSYAPAFERGWPSIYQALADGSIDEAALRIVWAKALLQDRPRHQIVWLGTDASPIPRPEAKTSQDRGIIHVSNLPRAAKPISVGWQVSSLMLLPTEPSSWVGILDQRRRCSEKSRWRAVPSVPTRIQGPATGSLSRIVPSMMSRPLN